MGAARQALGVLKPPGDLAKIVFLGVGKRSARQLPLNVAFMEVRQRQQFGAIRAYTSDG